MTVPVDLVVPGTLQDPVEEFFRQGGISVPEPDQTEGVTKKQVALIATALAASFLVYRMLMHRELDNSIAPSSKGEAKKLIERTFFKIAPLWARAALPAAVAAYQLGSYDSRTITLSELETLAQAYVKSLGEYLNTTSADAMLDGFQAQLNAKWSNELAWTRSVAGYGLDGPGTKSYIQSFAEGAKNGYIVDPVPRAAVKMVEKALGMRAKRFGDTEAWSAIQTGRNVVWMAQEASGDLPTGMKKRWVTAHDERVCVVCGPLDQRVIDIRQRFHANDGKKFYAPGVHPNCRCRIELVYPDGYINRVEELVRKSNERHYNRDQDGRFSHFDTLHSKPHAPGWTYAEAVDDAEKHPTVPKRSRQRTTVMLRPVTQETAFDEPKKTEVAEPQSAFGTTTSAASAFGATAAETSAFGGGGSSAFAAPTRAKVRAAARAQTAPVTTTTIYVVTRGQKVPVQVNVPPDEPHDSFPPVDDLGPMVFSLDAAMAADLKFSRRGRRAALTGYDPQLGDVLTFDQGWDADGSPLFDFGIDGLPSMPQQEENAIYEEQRRHGANAHDDFDYGEFVPEDIANPDTSVGGNSMVIFHIEDAVGYEGDDKYYVPIGSYMVTDVEDQEPTEKERAELGVVVRKHVTLEYINHTL